MASDLNKSLQGWVDAGLITPETSAAICAYEAAKPNPVVRWPARLAMPFGGATLASGILLLFVSSNWDALSPQFRFVLVASMVGGLHTAARHKGRAAGKREWRKSL